MSFEKPVPRKITVEVVDDWHVKLTVLKDCDQSHSGDHQHIEGLAVLLLGSALVFLNLPE